LGQGKVDMEFELERPPLLQRLNLLRLVHFGVDLIGAKVLQQRVLHWLDLFALLL
jgi:hypothetical protein